MSEFEAPMAVRLALLALILVGFPAAAAGERLAGAAPTRSLSRDATLRFVSFRPTIVAGRGFVQGERVRVRIRTRGKWNARNVTATRGAFTAAFSPPVDPCLGAIAEAVGNRGSRAVTKLQFRECAPRDRRP